jgi:molybdate transport system substrate-binding protein
MKMSLWFAALFMLIVVTSLVRADLVIAAELRLIALHALKESITVIASRYERATGDRIVLSWAGAEAITRRISDGTIFDVVVNASQNIVALEKT